MTKDFEFLSAAERGAALTEKREKSERRERIINAATRWIMIASGAAAAGVALAFLTAFLSASAHADALRAGAWEGSSTNGSSWAGSALKLDHGALGVGILTQAGDLPHASGATAPGPTGLLQLGGRPVEHVATSVAGLSWRLPFAVLDWGIGGGLAATDLTLEPAITTADRRSLGGLGWDARLNLTPGLALFSKRASWRILGATAPTRAGIELGLMMDGGILRAGVARLQGTGSIGGHLRGSVARVSFQTSDQRWRTSLAAQEVHGGTTLALAAQPASPSDAVGSTYADHALTASVEHQFNKWFSASLSVTKLHNGASGGVAIAYHF